MGISEKLFALTALKTQLVKTDRLGVVLIQAPDETKRAEIETTLKAAHAKRLIVVHTLIDDNAVDLTNPETGQARNVGEVWLSEPLPRALSKQHIDRMGTIDSTTIDDLAAAALKLMNMSQEDQSKLLGEPGKPSKTIPS